MVAEVLKEVGCEDSIEEVENVDKDEEKQDEDHAGDTSPDSSFSSPSELSGSGVDVNGSDDLLWNEIDLAERYLVSAMNEDAASTATIVLQTLSGLMHSSSSGSFCSRSCSSGRLDKAEEAQGAGEVGKSEHEEMFECAGMVLLQSYRAIGRVGEFFDILRALNLGVSLWPLILLKTGACLQTTDGVFPAARAALEEFLAVQSICLMEEKYAEVVELYVIEVLVKGLQETDSAVDWIERANVTQERRLVILKEIKLQMEHAKTAEPVYQPSTKSTTIGDTQTLEQLSVDVIDSGKEKGTKERSKLEWEVRTPPGADDSSIRSKSLTFLKRLKVSEGFFSIKTLLELTLIRLNAATSTWQPVSLANLERSSLRIGALVALFLFIYLRHLHTWRRFVGKSFSAFRVGLSDLWQLAFSVQINPLAALNPISAAY